jgi:hypothetical protein
MWYTIPFDSPCHVRKPGERHWTARRMRRGVCVQGMLWRNEYAVCVRWGVYELRAAEGDFYVTLRTP